MSAASEHDELRSLRHELRTPVNHIIGYSEMLFEDAEQAGQATLAAGLAQIRDAGQQITRLLGAHLSAERGMPGPNELGALGRALEPLARAITDQLAQLRPLAEVQAAAEILADLLKIRVAAQHLLMLIDGLLNRRPAGQP